MKITRLRINQQINIDGDTIFTLDALTDENMLVGVDYKNQISINELEFVFKALIEGLRKNEEDKIKHKLDSMNRCIQVDRGLIDKLIAENDFLRESNERLKRDLKRVTNE